MTNLHSLSSYQDGRVRVEFCKKCGAEGLKLLENCPQEIRKEFPQTFEKSLDEKKQTAK